MARVKFQGVVEAVRYRPDGPIEYVRVYERRGKTFSDRILLTREEFLARLQAGHKYVIGQRQKYLGGTFETGPEVVANGSKDQPVLLVTGQQSSERDDLRGVPVF